MMDAIKRYFRSPAAVVGLLLLLVVIVMAITASWIYPRDPLALAGRPLIWPFSNPRFLLGTDNSGRDIAAQIFYGARISLLIGGVATVIAVVIGVLIGAFAGYYGGWVDTVLMRITEAFQTLPNFVLLLVLVAVFGSTITTVTIAVGIVSWPAPARLTRAEFMSLRSREFVQAGRTLGMKDIQLILGEILPNALPPDGPFDPAGKRAGLPAAVRSQCGVMGQPHRPRPRRAARAVVCLGDPRHRHPAHRARGVAGRPGPQ
jgi:peptide/nickel transport system permease protein